MSKEKQLEKQKEKLLKAAQKYRKELEVEYAPNTIDKKLQMLNLVLILIFEYSLLLNDSDDILKLRDLIMERTNNNGRLLKINTRIANLNEIRQILKIIAGYNGLKCIINMSLLEKNLQPTRKSKNELKTYDTNRHSPATPEEVDKLFGACNGNDIYSLKYIAILTVLLCAGIRNKSARTLPLSAVIFHDGLCEIVQNPTLGVSTKTGGVINSYIIFPNQDIKNRFTEYIKLLKEHEHPDDAPLFPEIKYSKDSEGKKVIEFSKKFPKKNTYINKILKILCFRAGIEKRLTVHSCRHYFAKYMKPKLRTAAEFEACAKSMGHKSLKLLFDTYGKLSNAEVQEQMRQIQKRIFDTTENKFENLILQLKECAAEEPTKKRESILRVIGYLEYEFNNAT